MDASNATLERATLEVSLKPFFDESYEGMRKVCEELFKQWAPLLEQAEKASLLLWASDGSEILDYAGSLDDRFEWACWIGIANPIPGGERAFDDFDSVFHFPRKYREDAKPRTYRWLKSLVSVMKETCMELTGKRLAVGAIFDSGPEFAVSSFKYERHGEICNGSTIYPRSFATCDSALKADSRRYAGFPEGIAEGTSLGRFLGRQAACYARDIGFDYLWLSNGMGFGSEAWKYDGAIFDRKKFHVERIPEAKERMLRFWREFREEFKLPVETRGSNFSAGIEMSSDAAPLKELFALAKPARPVNSPWAAINRNPGFELTAWMSHFADAPESIPFRLYVDDIWFAFTPWRDMYRKTAWDIDMPLSVSALDSQGRARVASSVAILGANDCYGKIDPRIAGEVEPALLNALDGRPDAPGPLLWIYPLSSYDELATGKDARPDAVFAEDWFIGQATQEGLPLNSVCDATIFKTLVAEKPETFEGRVLVAPVSGLSPDVVKALRRILPRADGVLLYGSLEFACAELREIVGLRLSEGMDGDVSVDVAGLEFDSAAYGEISSKFEVFKQYCGGPLREVLDEKASASAVAWAEKGGERRVIASWRDLPDGGRVAWTRALVAGDPKSRSHIIVPPPATEKFPAARLPRLLLQLFGFSIVCKSLAAESMPPCVTISRKANAFVFSGLSMDASASLAMSLPLGAPLFNGSESFVEGSSARFNVPKSWRAECRFFVERDEPGLVACERIESHVPGSPNRFAIKGLKNSTLHFLPEPGSLGRLKIQPSFKGDPFSRELAEFAVEETPFGQCVTLRNLNGATHFVW